MHLNKQNKIILSIKLEAPLEIKTLWYIWTNENTTPMLPCARWDQSPAPGSAAACSLQCQTPAGPAERCSVSGSEPWACSTPPRTATLAESGVPRPQGAGGCGRGLDQRWRLVTGRWRRCDGGRGGGERAAWLFTRDVSFLTGDRNVAVIING